MSQDLLLTIGEVTARCKLGETLIRQLIRDGQFPAPIKIGRKATRWSVARLERWIAEQDQKTEAL